MAATTCLGFIQMQFPCGLYQVSERKGQPKSFWRNMALLGSMRYFILVRSR